MSLNIDKVYQDAYHAEIKRAYSQAVEEYNAQREQAEQGEDFETIPFFQESLKLAEENARLDEQYPAYDGETIDINGVQKTVYNSNGERIAKSAEALRNFYNWFGDSKVIDEQGRPLVVYHGTNAEFSVFDKSKQKGSSYYGKGFYFTNWSDVSTYGKIKMPLYLNIKNPLIIKEGDVSSLKAAEDVIGVHPDMPDEQKEWDFEGWAKYTLGYRSDIEGNIESVLSSKGYDGVVILDIENDGQRNKYIAFDSNQIKSTSNRGTFSKDNPDIFYQSGVADITRQKAREVKSALQKIADGAEEATVKDLRDDLEQYGGTNDVTFIYGDEKKGLFHIADKHGGVKTLLKVLDTVVDGKITEFTDKNKTVHLMKNGYEAILSLDEHGKKKTWLLTGFDTKISPDAEREFNAALKATQSMPTFSRQGLGAELDNFNITPSEANVKKNQQTFYQGENNPLGSYMPASRVIHLFKKVG